MKSELPPSLALVLCLLFALPSVMAQTPSSYDSTVRSGNAQLQAGHDERALSSAQLAIKMNSRRWEAHALAGGALMNLKRYEEAADELSEAIARAPVEKQPVLRDLRKQSLLAEAGAPSHETQTAAPAPLSTPTTQAEIVLWKSIESSSSADDFEAYLRQYPHGAFYPLATAHLEALEWTRLGNSQDLYGLEAFLKRFPDGMHASLVHDRIRALEGKVIACNAHDTGTPTTDADALGVALGCIQKAVQNHAAFSYSETREAQANQGIGPTQVTEEFRDFQADATACELRYTMVGSRVHDKSAQSPTRNFARTIALSTVTNVSVRPLDDLVRELMIRASAGRRPESLAKWGPKLDPPVFAVAGQVDDKDGSVALLTFLDKDVADTVSVAVSWAASLCKSR